MATEEFSTWNHVILVVFMPFAFYRGSICLWKWFECQHESFAVIFHPQCWGGSRSTWQRALMFTFKCKLSRNSTVCRTNTWGSPRQQGLVFAVDHTCRHVHRPTPSARDTKQAVVEEEFRSNIKENLSLFLNVFPLFQLVLCSCAYEKSWKILKRSESAPTDAPLSYRKHCSWNASSAVLPLIPRLCDITLRHHVTNPHHLCPVASLARMNWFSTGVRVSSVGVGGAGSGMCELTNQRRQGILEGAP